MELIFLDIDMTLRENQNFDVTVCHSALHFDKKVLLGGGFEVFFLRE